MASQDQITRTGVASGTPGSTCAERVAAELASRAAQVAELFDRCEDGSDEDAWDALAELPLSIDRQVVVNVLLSTGGPADWLEVLCSEKPHGLDVERVVFHFSDWFDHAEVPVPADSALHRLAVHYADGLSS